MSLIIRNNLYTERNNLFFFFGTSDWVKYVQIYWLTEEYVQMLVPSLIPERVIIMVTNDTKKFWSFYRSRMEIVEHMRDHSPVNSHLKSFYLWRTLSVFHRIYGCFTLNSIGIIFLMLYHLPKLLTWCVQTKRNGCFCNRRLLNCWTWCWNWITFCLSKY